MEELLDAVQMVGFPIAVTIFLLYERYHEHREERDSITKALEQLKIAVTELTTFMKTKF